MRKHSRTPETDDNQPGPPQRQAALKSGWNAASPVQLMRILRRLDPYLPAAELWLDPVIPADFGTFRAENLLLGKSRISLTVTAENLKVEGLGQDIRLHHRARPPLSEFLMLNT